MQILIHPHSRDKQSTEYAIKKRSVLHAWKFIVPEKMDCGQNQAKSIDTRMNKSSTLLCVCHQRAGQAKHKKHKRSNQNSIFTQAIVDAKCRDCTQKAIERQADKDATTKGANNFTVNVMNYCLFRLTQCNHKLNKVNKEDLFTL